MDSVTSIVASSTGLPVVSATVTTIEFLRAIERLWITREGETDLSHGPENRLGVAGA
jgi:hypothetical protein